MNNRYPMQQWAEWALDIESIKDELVWLMGKRTIWKAHNESLRGTTITDATAIVHDWLRENYADSMLMGLRRILDGTKGTKSLLKLLEELRGQTSLLSYDRFRTLCRDGEFGDTVAAKAYRQFSKDGRSFDPSIIEADILRLKNDPSKIIDYVNTNVAHRTADPRKGSENTTITYRDLHAAFGEVAGIINRYLLLLTASTVLEFDPVMPPGFEETFDRMLKKGAANSSRQDVTEASNCFWNEKGNKSNIHWIKSFEWDSHKTCADCQTPKKE